MHSYYSIFDKVSKKFGPIFEQANNDSAIRFFKHTFVNQPKEWMSDFCLYRLGSLVDIDSTDLDKIICDSFVFYTTPSLIYKGDSDKKEVYDDED